MAVASPEPTGRNWVVGLGAAVESDLRSGSFKIGGNVMLEWDAVAEWLELELELSTVTGDDGETEVPLGLLVKKPFRLAPWAELMVGVGPEVAHVFRHGGGDTFTGGQFALDFMFWPSQKFGFWTEPSYELVFHDGAKQSVGNTAGLLFRW